MNFLAKIGICLFKYIGVSLFFTHNIKMLGKHHGKLRLFFQDNVNVYSQTDTRLFTATTNNEIRFITDM